VTVREVRPERKRLPTDLADLPDVDEHRWVIGAFIVRWLRRHRDQLDVEQ